MTKLEETIERIQGQISYEMTIIQRLQASMALIQKYPGLAEFSLSIYSNYIDVSTTTRELLKAVRALFHGHVWTKQLDSSNNGTIDYQLEIDGVTISCRCAPPPPSCVIVEEWEDVPAQPATRKLVKKVKCPELPVEVSF